MLEAEDRAPGTVLDHDFLAEHTLGLDDLRAHLTTLDEQEVLTATGLILSPRRPRAIAIVPRPRAPAGKAGGAQPGITAGCPDSGSPRGAGQSRP